MGAPNRCNHLTTAQTRRGSWGVLPMASQRQTPRATARWWRCGVAAAAGSSNTIALDASGAGGRQHWDGGHSVEGGGAPEKCHVFGGRD